MQLQEHISIYGPHLQLETRHPPLYIDTLAFPVMSMFVLFLVSSLGLFQLLVTHQSTHKTRSKERVRVEISVPFPSIDLHVMKKNILKLRIQILCQGLYQEAKN